MSKFLVLRPNNVIISSSNGFSSTSSPFKNGKWKNKGTTSAGIKTSKLPKSPSQLIQSDLTLSGLSPKKRLPFSNIDEYGLPLLNPKDCFRRVEFASKMLEILEKDPTVLDSILFTDEGNFHLGKKLPSKETELSTENKSSQKSGQKKTLRKYGESKPLPQIVWLGITSKHAIGPYFFNSHVTDRTYLKMLRSYLHPQTEEPIWDKSLAPCWFQQDGAPPHRSREVLSYLKATFGQRLISYGCPTAWPPKSQDLTPLDFFLWDHLKEKLKANYLSHDLSTRVKFRKRLVTEVDNIEGSLLRDVIAQFPVRLEKCIQANGKRFPMNTQH